MSAPSAPIRRPAVTQVLFGAAAQLREASSRELHRAIAAATPLGYHQLTLAAVERLRIEIGANVRGWADDPGRTVEQIVAALTAAAIKTALVEEGTNR